MRYNCVIMLRAAPESAPGLKGAEAKADLVDLLGFLTDLQAVERRIYLPALDRYENDTEHSYNLAMAAWLIVAQEKLPLNVDLVIRYALVHDLVEVYAGDTFAFDDEAGKDKAVREHVAMQRLKTDGSTADFAAVAEEYERLDNEESRFVYGLDKLMAAFTVIHGRVPIWRDNGVTLEAFVNRFQAKVEGSAYLKPYWKECLRLLDENPSLLAN